MARAEPRYPSRGKAATRFLITLVVVSLLGAVGYLAARVNSGRYRLRAEGQRLLVERGRFLPFGFEPYVPEVAPLARAYEPISLPEGARLGLAPVYEDRVELDRALFGLLAGWAEERLATQSEEMLAAAEQYIDRAELLPAVSEEQREELRGLRGRFAYRKAYERLTTVTAELERARAELRTAVRLGAAEGDDVQAWLSRIGELIEVTRDMAAQAPSGRNAPTTRALPVSPPPAERTSGDGAPLGEAGDE